MKATEHKKYLFEICEKIDLDLNSPTCKKLRDHLAQCPNCAAYYDSLKKTIVLYRDYNIEMNGSRVKEILTRLDLSEGSRQSESSAFDGETLGDEPLKINIPKKHRH